MGRQDRAKDRLTRRRLLGAGAAGAAGYAVAGPVGVAEAKLRPRKVDVIVVGAGLAGLAAGRRLKQAGKSFVVLEARNRVGGRTLNRPLARDKVVEIGGQWVGPTQDRVLRLIKDLGLRTFKTFVGGDNLYYRNGSLQRYTGTIPPVDPAVLVELANVLSQTDSMASQVPLEAPWDAASALEWDSQTAETWKLQHTVQQETRDLYDLAIASVFAAEPRDLSLLHVLFYTHAAGSFEHLIDTAGGAQDSRIVGGSQQIAIRLANRLGRSVILDAPVYEIDHGRRHVEIATRHGRFVGRRAIIAMAPALAARIRYSPPLPARRDQLTQHVPMGTVIKCMAVYDRPFWRAAGLSGMVTSNTGPVKLTFDNSPPGARRYIDKSWAADPWTRGCYVGYFPPGVLVSYRDAIWAPVDRLHWAGTETATLWNGYMDGAIQSGYRAAKEVLERL